MSSQCLRALAKSAEKNAALAVVFFVVRWLAQRSIFSCSYSSREQLLFKRLKLRLCQQASVEQLFKFEQLVGR